MPAPTVTIRDSRSSSATPLIRRMSSAITASCPSRSGSTPPTTLVPPPNGTTASPLLGAQLEHRPHLLVVRPAARPRPAPPRARRRACARDRHTPSRRRAPPVRHDRRAPRLCRRSPPAPPSRCAESRVWGSLTSPSATGGLGGSGLPDDEEATPTVWRSSCSVRSFSAGPCSGSPHPHQRILEEGCPAISATRSAPGRPVLRRSFSPPLCGPCIHRSVRRTRSASV